MTACLFLIVFSIFILASQAIYRFFICQPILYLFKRADCLRAVPDRTYQTKPKEAEWQKLSN